MQECLERKAIPAIGNEALSTWIGEEVCLRRSSWRDESVMRGLVGREWDAWGGRITWFAGNRCMKPFGASSRR